MYMYVPAVKFVTRFSESNVSILFLHGESDAPDDGTRKLHDKSIGILQYAARGSYLHKRN